jgi:hypothetical protein
MTMRVGRLVVNEGGEKREGDKEGNELNGNIHAHAASKRGGCPMHGGGGGGGGALSSGPNTSPPGNMNELLGDPTKPYMDGRSYW